MLWKTSFLNIFNLALFISCTFKVTLAVFADIFKEYYSFALIRYPFQTLNSQRAVFYTLPVKLKIKIHGNDNFVFKIIGLPNNYLELLKRSNIKVNWKIQEIKRLFFSWLMCRKRHILRLRCLAIPLLTKTLIIYLKMVNRYSNLLCYLKIWCLRKFRFSLIYLQGF